MFAGECKRNINSTVNEHLYLIMLNNLGSRYTVSHGCTYFCFLIMIWGLCWLILGHFIQNNLNEVYGYGDYNIYNGSARIIIAFMPS